MSRRVFIEAQIDVTDNVDFVNIENYLKSKLGNGTVLNTFNFCRELGHAKDERFHDAVSAFVAKCNDSDDLYAHDLYFALYKNNWIAGCVINHTNVLIVEELISGDDATFVKKIYGPHATVVLKIDPRNDGVYDCLKRLLKDIKIMKNDGAFK